MTMINFGAMFFHLKTYFVFTQFWSCKWNAKHLLRRNIFYGWHFNFGCRTWPEFTLFLSVLLWLHFGCVHCTLYSQNKWMHLLESKHSINTITVSLSVGCSVLCVCIISFYNVFFIFLPYLYTTERDVRWRERENVTLTKCLLKGFIFMRKDIIMICIRLVDHSWSYSCSVLKTLQTTYTKLNKKCCEKFIRNQDMWNFIWRIHFSVMLFTISFSGFFEAKRIIYCNDLWCNNVM